MDIPMDAKTRDAAIRLICTGLPGPNKCMGPNCECWQGNGVPIVEALWKLFTEARPEEREWSNCERCGAAYLHQHPEADPAVVEGQKAATWKYGDPERRKDNWTLIQKQYHDKIGGKYRCDRTGEELVFFGLVDGDDDYYYGLMRKDRTVILASCVGALDSWYEPVSAPQPHDAQEPK